MPQTVGQSKSLSPAPSPENTTISDKTIPDHTIPAFGGTRNQLPVQEVEIETSAHTRGQDPFLQYIAHITTTTAPPNGHSCFFVDVEGRTVASATTPSIRIHGHIENQAVDLLVDCGADVSVMSLTLATRLALDIKPTIATMRSANGQPIQCAGYVTCQLYCSADEPLTVTALVAPDLHDSGLLGCDFLNRYKAVLDFATQTVRLAPGTSNAPEPEGRKPPDTVQTHQATIRRLIQTAEQSQPQTLPSENILNEVATWSHLHPHKRRLITSAVIGLPADAVALLLPKIKSFTLLIPQIIARRKRGKALSRKDKQELNSEAVDTDMINAQCADVNHHLHRAWRSVEYSKESLGSRVLPTMYSDGTLEMLSVTIASFFAAAEPPVVELCNAIRSITSPVHDDVVTPETGEYSETQNPITPQDLLQDPKKTKTIQEEVESWDRLTPQQRKELGAVLALFDESTLRVKMVSTIKDFAADIPLLEGAQPVKMRDRHWSPDQLEIIRRDINDMLKNGWIRKGYGSWAARLVPVLKSDGTIRMCADYRALNDRTKADAYPSANPDIIMDRLHGKKYFSKLDALKGYYQIRLDDNIQELTGFTCPLGLFQFTVLPFGLKNAPAIFQRMMDDILGEYKGDFTDVLLDDILIYSDTFEEHLEHIQKILTRLKLHNVVLRFDKCSFACTELIYLGHIITQDGKKVDPEKVSAVLHMAVPQTKKQLRSFIGMASYLRRYVKNFAEIINPLTELTKKEVPEKNITPFWTPTHLAAFEQIKQILTTAPVLAHPDFNRPFIVETDASDYAVGAMLAQEYTDAQHRTVHRPIAYSSAKLNPAQTRYDATNREGLACVWAIKKFEHYLRRHPVTIITDHNPLTSMQTAAHNCLRVERWKQILQEFQPKFVFRKGAAHHGPDALSRVPRTDIQDVLAHDYDRVDVFDEHVISVVSTRSATKRDAPKEHEVPEDVDKEVGHETRVTDTTPSPLTATTIESPHLANLWPQDKMKRAWHDAQRNDSILGPIIKYVIEGIEPDTKTVPRYFIRRKHVTYEVRPDDLLYLVFADSSGKASPPVVAVPNSHVTLVLHLAHDESSADGGHYGVSKTYESLILYCWWPRMYSDTEQYVKGCLRCQRFRKGPLAHIPQVSTDLTPVRPMQVVGVDTCAVPRTPDGYDKMLVAVDHFTRFTWAFPMIDIKANSIGGILQGNVFSLFGWPEVLVSDSGTEFRNHLLMDLCHNENTENRFISVGHPQANGMVEGQNKTLLQQLRTTCNGNPTTWPQALPHVIASYNRSPLRGLGISPHELMFGTKPVPRVVHLLDVQDPEQLTPQHLFEARMDAQHLVTEKREQVRQQARDKANEKLRAVMPKLTDGQMVWVHAQKTIQARHRNRDVKLDADWTGPYVIIESKENRVSYRVRPLGGSTLMTYHAEHIRPLLLDDGSPIVLDADHVCHIDTGEPSARISTKYNPKLTGKSYEVSAVVNHKWMGRQLYFAMTFEGYADTYWYPEIQCDCPLLVSKYITSLNRAAEIGNPSGTPAHTYTTMARASAVKRPETGARAK